MSIPTRLSVLNALQTHEHRDPISQRVAAVALAAARQQRSDYLTGETVAESSEPLPSLEPSQAETDVGNALTILDRGANTREEWLLLSCALSRAIAARFEDGDQEVLRELGWLAANTPCNAWLYFDEWFPPADRAAFWATTAAACEQMPVSQQLAVALGACMASSPEAAGALSAWEQQTTNPSLAFALSHRAEPSELEGELESGRLSRFTTVLLGLTGVLALRALWRLFSRYVLGLKHAARIRVSGLGIHVEHEQRLLGHKIREGQRLIPFEHIASLERETRYSGLALYAGLFALVLGTYLGTGLLVDSVRVVGGSPSLLGFGLGVITLGIALDYALAKASELRRGRARLSLRTSKGPSLMLRNCNGDAADATLRRLQSLRASSY